MSTSAKFALLALSFVAGGLIAQSAFAQERGTGGPHSPATFSGAVMTRALARDLVTGEGLTYRAHDFCRPGDCASGAAPLAAVAGVDPGAALLLLEWQTDTGQAGAVLTETACGDAGRTTGLRNWRSGAATPAPDCMGGFVVLARFAALPS